MKATVISLKLPANEFVKITTLVTRKTLKCTYGQILENVSRFLKTFTAEKQDILLIN